MNIDEKALRYLADREAVIIRESTGPNSYIVVPNGDRRKRPIAWIDTKTLKRFIQSGSVQKYMEKRQERYQIVKPSPKKL
ncbi:MAG: hypothetical protein V3U57_04135 [Robiginitomaculum sp.]